MKNLIVNNETVCQEADRIVSYDRGQQYGDPTADFSRIAKMWSAILGIYVSPQQVGMCMILLKISRESHLPKRDNLVDIAGYAKCVDMINEKRGYAQNDVPEKDGERVR